MNGVRLRAVRIERRVHAVMMLLALGASLLTVRAIDVQLLRRDFYQSQGEARHLREIAIPVSRGAIYDRNGEPLAMSSPVDSLWAHPRTLLAEPARIGELAAALSMPAAELEDLLRARADREFLWLRRHLAPHEAEAILARGIPGVAAQREFRRFYPAGEVFAHVIGSTDLDDRGKEGLELAYDGWLAGKPGAQRVLRDRRGRVVEVIERTRAPEPGRDLVLSLDRRLQYLAYRELKIALAEHAAASGSIVILDAATGEVLAMVNLPSHNPNSRQPQPVGGAAQPGGDRRLRAGLGDQALHRARRTRERALPPRERDRHQPGQARGRAPPGARHPQLRAPRPHRAAREVEQRRRGADRPRRAGRGLPSPAAPLRLRPAHRLRLSRASRAGSSTPRASGTGSRRRRCPTATASPRPRCRWPRPTPPSPRTGACAPRPSSAAGTTRRAR
ncbi:MAG: hypothetical protein RML12_02740 [Xanthomonadales bacterium]|nr:hypothetical protein [Xanthomonadales bacterium]